MPGVKRFNYDTAFSRAIREAWDWTCASCGLQSAEGQATGKCTTMQCAHVFSRKHLATRCYPINAVCLCASCHATYTDAPTEWGRFVTGLLGEGQYQLLLERHNTTAKYSKADKNAIADHYRQEYNRLRKLRKEGAQGCLNLVGYD